MKLVRSAGSLTVGIVLLILILLASVAGVILPQDVSAHFYVERFGSVAGSMMVSIGLHHLFTSLWYTALLILFAINISICTLIRLGSSVKSFAKPRFLAVAQVGALPLHDAKTANGESAAVGESIVSLLRKRWFLVAIRNENGTVSIDARQGRLHDIGSALLHLSLLPLLIGGFIAKFTGYSYVEHLQPGKSAEVRERSFSVRCDYFKLERNKDGEIKDYISGLTLVDTSGKPLASKAVEVNHPLTYQGITFYQSSYSSDPSEISDVNLVVTGADIGAVGRGIRLAIDTPVTIPGTGITVKAGQFIPDFLFDTETKTAQSRSDEPNNPALYVTVCKAQDTLFAGWVFQKFGAMHHDKEAYGVSFISYEQQQTTGLLIKKNPGSPIIWFGILGMSLGILLVFWIPRRRIWAVVAAKANRAEGLDVTLGASLQREDATGNASWETIQKLFA